MAAVALLKFNQGPNTDVAGRAVLGTLVGVDGAVTITNATSGGGSDIDSWEIYLLDAPPESTNYPTTLFDDGSDGRQKHLLASAADDTPTTTISPDALYGYRVMLVVRDAAGVEDVDIRVFAVPDAEGFVRPPYQKIPDPLPVLGSGKVNAKPEEMNFNGQIRGWAGTTGTAPKMFDAVLGEVRKLNEVTRPSAGELALAGNLTVNGNATVTGKLTVGGLIDPIGLVLSRESPSNVPTGAGEGGLFVGDGNEGTVAGRLYYKDENNPAFEQVQTSAAGGETLQQTLVNGEQTGGRNIEFTGGDNILLLGTEDDFSISFNGVASAAGGSITASAQTGAAGEDGGGIVLSSGAGGAGGGSTDGSIGLNLVSGGVNPGAVQFLADSVPFVVWATSVPDLPGQGFQAILAGDKNIGIRAADEGVNLSDGGNITLLSGHGGTFGVGGDSGDISLFCNAGGTGADGGQILAAAGISSDIAASAHATGGTMLLVGGLHNGGSPTGGDASIAGGDVNGTDAVTYTAGSAGLTAGAIGGTAGTRVAGNIVLSLRTANASAPGGTTGIIAFQDNFTPFATWDPNASLTITYTPPAGALSILSGANGTAFTVGYSGAATGSGGSITLQAQGGGVTSPSGDAIVQGGIAPGASGGSGGDAILRAGAGDGGGVDGSAVLDLTTGGTTAGTVQFQQDGTPFATWNPSASLTVTYTPPAGALTIQSGGDGTKFNIQYSGNSTAGLGGSIDIAAQGGGATFDGGDVFSSSAPSNAGAGNFAGGATFSFRGGQHNSGDPIGGSITLDTGNVSGTPTNATAGDFQFTTGTLPAGGTTRTAGSFIVDLNNTNATVIGTVQFKENNAAFLQLYGPQAGAPLGGGQGFAVPNGAASTDFVLETGTDAGGAGGDFGLYTAPGTSSSGGGLEVALGDGFGAFSGGDGDLTAGSGGATGDGGSWQLAAGASGGTTSGSGAELIVAGGQHNAGSPIGGTVTVQAGGLNGIGVNGTAGGILLETGFIGDATGTTTAGSILLNLRNTNADTAGTIQFQENGSALTEWVTSHPIFGTAAFQGVVGVGAGAGTDLSFVGGLGGPTDGNGGNVIIAGGAGGGTTGNGGGVTIAGGSAAAGGSHGGVAVALPASSAAVSFNVVSTPFITFDPSGALGYTHIKPTGDNNFRLAPAQATSGAGALVEIWAGQPAGGGNAGAALDLRASSGNSAAAGGFATLSAGGAVVGTAGNAVVQTTDTTAGTAGNIVLNLRQTGSSTKGVIEFQEDGTPFMTWDPNASLTVTLAAGLGAYTLQYANQTSALGGSSINLTAQTVTVAGESAGDVVLTGGIQTTSFGTAQGGSVTVNGGDDSDGATTGAVFIKSGNFTGTNQAGTVGNVTLETGIITDTGGVTTAGTIRLDVRNSNADTTGRIRLCLDSVDVIEIDESGGNHRIGFFAAAPAVQFADIVALTDNSGGAATDNTIQALTDPADAPATADALRDDLVANLIPELRNNLRELTEKSNALRNFARAHGLMA